MKGTFDINFVNDHLLITDNGQTILVDTGSPVTVHRERTFNFLGRDFAVATSLMGDGVEQISKLAGFGFNTLMGMDILSQYRLVFDYAGKKLTFLTENEPGIEGTEVPMVNLGGGVKAVMMQAGGKSLKMALDTGAPLSYVTEKVTAGLDPVGEKDDFHPAVGRFKTPVYKVETEVAGKKFLCSYGTLPTRLSMIYRIMDGVIGYDFFNSFTVMMDYAKGLLVIA